MTILKKLLRPLTHILYKVFLEAYLKKQSGLRRNKRVLVQINSGIGDAIMTLPMICTLSSNGFEVHVLANQYTETIAKLCPDVDRYYVIDRSIATIQITIKHIMTLNKLKFRYFIGALPSNLIRDAFLPIFLRIPIRSKHMTPHDENYRNYDFMFNHLVKLNAQKNNTEGNLELLEEIAGVEIKEIKHNVKLSSHILTRVKQQLRHLGYQKDKITIGVHPGCKETWAFKRWPAERYRELLGTILKDKNLQIVLFGGAEERELANQVINNLNIKPFNLVGELSIEETITAVSLCQMFISNDSALMHIATLFDMPVVALFGRTNELATGPYGNRHVVIKKQDVKDIRVHEVYEKTVSILRMIASNDKYATKNIGILNS